VVTNAGKGWPSSSRVPLVRYRTEGLGRASGDGGVSPPPPGGCRPIQREVTGCRTMRQAVSMAKAFIIGIRGTPRRRTILPLVNVEGAAKQVKGKVKDVAGKLTGDQKMRAEGKIDKAEGKVQNTYGGMKDKAREALDDE
jgi:uncharacterized protein YjbJ (UPF0337 family)